MLFPESKIGFGDFFRVTFGGDFAVFDHNGTITELANVFHRVGDKYDSSVTFKRTELVVTLLFESGIADSEDLIENKNVATSANRN